MTPATVTRRLMVTCDAHGTYVWHGRLDRRTESGVAPTEMQAWASGLDWIKRTAALSRKEPK